MRQYAYALGLALALLPSPLKAQGIPVYDAAGFVQVVTQLEQMAKDYQKQISQLEEAIKQTSALTGSRQAGSLLNDDEQKAMRHYLPDSYDAFLTMDVPSSDTQETRAIYDALIKLYQLDESNDIYSELQNSPLEHATDRRNRNIMAAMAASEQAYANASIRIELYQGLLDELDQTKDIKDSVDLQARIAAENGMVMSEFIKLSTIKIQLDTASENHARMTDRRAEQAHKYNPDAARAAMQTNPKR